MFWLQVFLPIGLALLGLALLYSDDYKKQIFLRNSLENSRRQIVAISERQTDKSEIKPRLAELGKNTKNSYGEFRYRQLMAAAIGAFLPFAALFIMLINFYQAISLSIFSGIASYLLYDKYLTNLVKERRNLIEAEFPAIIEMLTLAIAAGESPVSAFARIANRSDAVLAIEFQQVVAKVKQGRPFHEALDEMGRTLKSSSIRRFVDALVMAMVRGAPIVDVLHRHVAEARINQRNLVMDKAGKAETMMMIPIVFLILPISVLFALWPSINQLSFFAS